MKILKQFIKSVLHQNGYDITKVNLIKEREIYHAYYLGKCFKCIKGDPLADHILKGKIWDHQLLELLKARSSRPGIVVEIGANIGASILPHSKNFPEKKFKLFEPVPTFFNLLKSNHETYNEASNVDIFNMGFGLKKDELIPITIGLATAGKSKLVQYQMADQTINIPSQKIDDYFKDELISFMKIDVDGHELNILKGGEKLLSTQTPDLFLEFAPKVISDIHQRIEEIPTLLKIFGYNQITIWDNESVFIKRTNDWNELIDIALKTPHYLDLFIEKI